MTVLHNLVIFRDSLSRDHTYSILCTAILKNIQSIRTCTIEDAAALCFTSPATLSRFIRALGYENYSEFRTSLDRDCRNYYFANRVMPRIPDNTFHPGEEYLDQLVSQIEVFRRSVDLEAFPAIVDDLAQARQVGLYLGQIQFSAAVQLQVDLTLGGIDCALCRTRAEQLMHAGQLGENSFAVVSYQNFTGGQEAHLYSELLKMLREKETRVLMIAPQSRRVPQNLCSHLLTYPSTDTAMDNYQMQLLLSLLTLTYRTRYLDGTLAF